MNIDPKLLIEIKAFIARRPYIKAKVISKRFAVTGHMAAKILKIEMAAGNVVEASRRGRGILYQVV